MNYRRTKKILLSDPTGDISEGENSVVENDDDDDKSEAVSCFYWICRHYFSGFIFKELCTKLFTFPTLVYSNSCLHGYVT